MTEIAEQLAIFSLVFAAFITHMVPSLMAFERQHPQKFTVLAVNCVPVLGWFVAMVLLAWSNLELRRELASPKR